MTQLAIHRCFGLLLLAPIAATAQIQAPPAAFDLTPFSPYTLFPGRPPELHPIQAGDTILVTTTLRLFAFAAATGELRWSAGPPAGWEAFAKNSNLSLFQGIDFENVYIAPAASANTAVAALQVPLAREKDDAWQGIEIMKSLPERRLFAFDLASGRPLWNHAPAAPWDPGSGPFQERMSLIGPPLVAGERVLVPCASDASKVDYHVACYALDTGKLLWSTPVVEGQVERNMFGRAVHEFAAAPLALAAGTPERVLAQTGLGLVAALELATGAVCWRAEYEPIPLPKTRSYNTLRRTTHWRRAPPLVIDDVVLATPADSRELLALDLADGHRLWSVAAQTLAPEEPDAFDHLIGAREAVLYLGGARVRAFTKREGLRAPGALEPLWSASLPEVKGRSARAQLVGEHLFVARGKECLVLERASGKALAPFPFENAVGSLATEAALFVWKPDGLHRLAR